MAERWLSQLLYPSSLKGDYYFLFFLYIARTSRKDSADTDTHPDLLLLLFFLLPYTACLMQVGRQSIKARTCQWHGREFSILTRSNCRLAGRQAGRQAAMSRLSLALSQWQAAAAWHPIVSSLLVDEPETSTRLSSTRLDSTRPLDENPGLFPSFPIQHSTVQKGGREWNKWRSHGLLLVSIRRG